MQVKLQSILLHQVILMQVMRVQLMIFWTNVAVVSLQVQLDRLRLLREEVAMVVEVEEVEVRRLFAVKNPRTFVK
jgi:hypothetical protein